VKWWFRGDFSHVELVFGEPREDGKSLCWSSTFLDGGVRAAWQDISNDDWVVVELPNDPAKEQYALAWFEAHRGLPYDVRGLFGFLVRRLPDDQKAYFCNESVGAALRVFEPWRQDPNSFYSVAEVLAAG
jgi:hypothetical protein